MVIIAWDGVHGRGYLGYHDGRANCNIRAAFAGVFEVEFEFCRATHNEIMKPIVSYPARCAKWLWPYTIFSRLHAVLQKSY